MSTLTSAVIEAADTALPPKVVEVLGRVGDAKLRVDVESTVRHAFLALAELKRVHLPQNHFEEAGAASADPRHTELAPYVLAAVASVNKLVAQLMETYPAPAEAEATSDMDFDLEFDLVDGPTGQGKGLTTAAPKAAQGPAEQVADAAHAYGSMLRARVVELAGRLRHALAQTDGWPLLAELDDYQHRLAKAVMGVLFGVLGIFGSDARREEILPEYRSSVGEAVGLRRAITDLTFQVARFNAKLADVGPEDAVPLLVGVSDWLGRFSERSEYRTLRAEDKRAFIDFRRVTWELRRAKAALSMVKLRQSVEGFSKFLESMQAINHREVLVIHDRAVLEGALSGFERAMARFEEDPSAARAEFSAVVEGLWAVYGRNPELDRVLRDHRGGDPGKRSLVSELSTWQPLCQQTIGMCG